MRVMAFQRNDVDVGLLQFGEGFLVLAPLRAQRLLPVGVGLDAVAVADVHGGFALQAFDGAFQGGDAPVVHLVEEDVEGRLVELDDVDAGGFEFPGFLVEDLGEFPGQLFAALVVGVVEGVDHRHGAGQGPLDGLRGLLAQELGVFDEDRLLAAHGADDGRHAGVVAVADPDGFALFEIDAVQVLDEGGDEVLAGLLAVADDVDAGVLLFVQGQAQGVLLAFDQFLVLQLPGRPELFRLGQPGGFGQAAGGRSGQ
ncbi:Uncharacterised protein [Achromobacter xylosoxidans]|nr:Uncharacterised protein [Achromobacter xylosoxidans]